MKNKLTYFISSTYMFGIGFFLLFKNAGKDAWISIILGSIIGIIILYIYSKIKEKVNNKDLKNNSIGKLYIFFFLLFNLYLIMIILIILPMFVNSFYLIYTPKIMVVIPFLILAIYVSSKEKRVLETLSTLLSIGSILIILTYGIFLTKYMNFSNLTPIMSTNHLSIIKASLIYASLSAIPNIITINFHNNDFKYELKIYLLSNIIILFITISTILSLGEPLIKIYSFPEYAVLKQIKIFSFIENVENLSTFIWYFNLFITLSILTTNVKDALPHKYNKISYLSLMILITFLSINIISSNYRFIITIFYYHPWILFIFFILFLPLLFIKRKKASQ